MARLNDGLNDRDGPYFCARQATTQSQQREPQQQQGATPQQRRAGFEGGIVADEIAKALRHTGDHLLIALPLVHPAVDFESQIPGDGGVGLHQILVLALGTAQGAGQLLRARLQLGMAKLIGIDPAGRGCWRERDHQAEQQEMWQETR